MIISGRTIPGLLYFSNFITKYQHDALVSTCLGLRQQIHKLENNNNNKSSTTNIPQPGHVKSSKHNLSSEETFVRMQVVDPDINNNDNDDGTSVSSSLLQCEHFPKYGEKGHELTYYRNNRNIPQRIWEELVLPTTERVDPVTKLASSSRRKKNEELNWKLTINTYCSSTTTLAEENTKIAGFPFHVDIPSNGEITMILSLLKGAQMELGNENDDENDVENLVSVKMEPRGLLVLSGEARYKWRHRVLPSSVISDRHQWDPPTSPVSDICGDIAEEGDMENERVCRISVVLGCR